MNNVREGMGEEDLAELGWDTIFQEIYDDEKKKSEKGTNFNQFQGGFKKLRYINKKLIYPNN